MVPLMVMAKTKKGVSFKLGIISLLKVGRLVNPAKNNV